MADDEMRDKMMRHADYGCDRQTLESLSLRDSEPYKTKQVRIGLAHFPFHNLVLIDCACHI